jgi:hypothetical protein
VKEIIQKQTVSSVQGETRLKNLLRRQLANLRVAIRLLRLQRHEPDGQKLRRLERFERVAQVSLNQHIERAIKQKLTKPADQRQRNLGDLFFGVSGLFPFANVSGNSANGCVSCFGGGGEEKVFAYFASLGFELEMGEFVAF